MTSSCSCTCFEIVAPSDATTRFSTSSASSMTGITVVSLLMGCSFFRAVTRLQDQYHAQTLYQVGCRLRLVRESLQ